MRDQAKRTKRTVGFYTNSYGFREPFNVLVDGTFCQAALGPKIHIKEAIPSQLGGPAQLGGCCSCGPRLIFCDERRILCGDASPGSIRSALVTSLTSGCSTAVTTPCVINEVEQLGEDLLGAKLILRRFKTRSCGHRVPIDADQCIKSMVKGGNRHHFFLATQDPAVKRSVAEVPGVPVFTIVSNVLILEPPSRASVLEAEKVSNLAHDHSLFLDWCPFL